jgi:carbon monoxide dehydrogenase subunit G
VRLENTFQVLAPPEHAWDLLMDVPRIVPCMPGTELTETLDDSTWKARMKVKLGPIAMIFDTDVVREETDGAARRAVLVATAKELRGRGGGTARIESSLEPDGAGTRVTIVTDLSLSGTVAQYGGRGMVQAVSAQLVDAFAACLQRELEAPAADAPAAGDAPPVPPPAPAQPLSALSLARDASLARGRALGRRPLAAAGAALAAAAILAAALARRARGR